jgi:sodium pump decarboxylase gamma subunit
MPTVMAEGWTTQFETMSEKLFLATTLTIVGFSIVFIALFIIIICIRVMSGSVNSLSGRKKLKAVNTVKEPVLQESSEAPNVNTEEYDDYELAAVITAAITASQTSGHRSAPYPGFRVRSIRRV